MMRRRLEAVLAVVRDPKAQVNAFVADCLVAAIREGAVHLVVLEPDAAPDSLDRLADMQKRQADPPARSGRRRCR